MTFYQYLMVCMATYKGSHSTLRMGQVYYNVLYTYRPNLGTEVNGGDMDPFHIDSRIPQFLSWVEAHWDREEE